MGYRVAVVGATGNVGREMMNVLEELEFPIDEIHAVASRKSVGIEVSYAERTLKCVALDSFDFSTVDIVLMSAGGTVSKEWSEKIGAAGPVVIDNSSAWRMHPDVPLIVPEVNPDAVEGFRKKNIIANPNCSTIQLVVALKPLHDEVRIKRVVVSTYQSVSGAGKEGMDELWNQTKGVFVLGAPPPKKFSKQIAFNLIPQIDDFLDDGTTKEEWKMMVETQKILDPMIKLTATCVRVPVLRAHSEAVNIEFEAPFPVEEARALLAEAPGVTIIDDQAANRFPMPMDVTGRDPVAVGRLRQDISHPRALELWLCGDQLRKGAALHAIQIADLLMAGQGGAP